MSFNNFMKRIICFSMSCTIFVNNSFAGKIINNPLKNLSPKTKNEKKPVKILFKLFEKWDNLTPKQKKYIVSEIFGWGMTVLDIFLIKKLYNALFSNQSTETSSITTNEKNQITKPTFAKTSASQKPASPKTALIPENDKKIPEAKRCDSPFANLTWKKTIVI